MQRRTYWGSLAEDVLLLILWAAWHSILNLTKERCFEA